MYCDIKQISYFWCGLYSIAKMKENDKLINAIIDLSQEVKRLGANFDGLSQEIKGMRKDMNHQLGELNTRVDSLNNRVGKLEKQQQRTNAELSEIRLSFIQYANSFEKSTDHEKRINKLERIVLKG